MDINSLLSPQDTPTGETPPPIAPTSSPYPSPGKRPARPTKRASSYLSHHVAVSPRTPQDQLLTPALSQNGSVQLPHIPLQSPGLTSAPNGRHGHSATSMSTPPADARAPQPPFHRQSSTPGMDTLADLASMQRHQQPSPSGRSNHRATSVGLQSIPRSISVTSMKDMAMADASPKSPKIFATKSLSADECQTLTQLSQSLLDKPFDYTWNIQFTGLLRKGFREHVNSGLSPRSYELLSDLRQARNAMDSKYSLGQEMWAEWINDEKQTVQNTDDRLKLMELCGRAIVEEPTSVLLWRLYGEFMYDCWASANAVEGADAWTEEDRLVGKEIFTFEAMKDVWEQAASATQWRINDSNLVWDRWMELLQLEQKMWPKPTGTDTLEEAFSARLLRPHATWDETFQMFSTFVSTYYNTEYERIMESISKQAGHAKKQYAMRENFEFKIQSASQKGDRDAEWYAFQSYLEWERRHQGVFSFNLINGLYERATLRFHNDPSLWEDYVEFLIQNPSPDVSLVAVVERATRHCPWSGNLWSYRILTLEAESKSFTTIENVKHKATETGMLETAGMEELIKIYTAWCGYLRRKAFQTADPNEDDIDIAEVGIRSALEHVREIGEKQFGKTYQGDPQYRLERTHIKFLRQSGNIAAARDIWHGLIEKQGNSYDFWYRYYLWEMMVWAQFSRPGSGEGATRTPEEATALLRKALTRVDTMDWPEQLVTMYLNHCEQHESVQVLRMAMIEARKANAQAIKRREREQAEAAAAAQQQQAAQQSAQDEAPFDSLGKRKRGSTGSEATSKRTKGEIDSHATGESENASMADNNDDAAKSATSHAKRDRENATIFVKNLPADVTQTRVRQFFRGSGDVVSVSLQPEHGSQTAVVEFDNAEDAEYALAKQGQLLDGNEIEISLGSQTTLFVSNYPAHADEGFIRGLFGKYGEVVAVRFPSLKYNTHRRFCYVQFMTREQAVNACELDGHSIEGHNIVAKISDPSRKKDREGASYEGREVFVRNVHWKAQEEDVKTRFVQFGTVESVRIPRKIDGNSKGVAYVVFQTKEQAQAAIDGLNGQQFMSRPLGLEISQPYGKAKRHQTTILHSASPEPTQSHRANGTDDHPNYKERTIALLNIPDTVNDARIRALAEPYGPLVKIKLMPEHQGAIVEFQHVADAGKAALGIEGHEIAPGRRIGVGTVAEMLRDKEEFRKDRLVGGGGGSSSSSKPAQKKSGHGAAATSGGPEAALKLASGFVSRPGQPGAARRGGRGGLGFRKGMIGTGARRNSGAMDTTGAAAAAAAAAEPAEHHAPSHGKSNADFKAMVSGSG